MRFALVTVAIALIWAPAGATMAEVIHPNIKGGNPHPPPSYADPQLFATDAPDPAFNLTDADKTTASRAAEAVRAAKFGARTVIFADTLRLHGRAWRLQWRRALALADTLVSDGVYPGSVEVVRWPAEDRPGLVIEVFALKSNFADSARRSDAPRR